MTRTLLGGDAASPGADDALTIGNGVDGAVTRLVQRQDVPPYRGCPKVGISRPGRVVPRCHKGALRRARGPPRVLRHTTPKKDNALGPAA